MTEPATTAALILGGSGLLSSGKGKKGGKKGGGNDALESLTQSAELQSQIATQLFGSTQPLRTSLLGGDTSMGSSPALTNANARLAEIDGQLRSLLRGGRNGEISAEADEGAGGAET